MPPASIKRNPAARRAPAEWSFNATERAFFAAGTRIALEDVASTPATGTLRRIVLRCAFALVVAAAGALAWQGPGRAAAPQVAALMRPAGVARSGATAQAREAFQMPRAASAAAAAVPGPRPAPHPVTAARQRVRRR